MLQKYAGIKTFVPPHPRSDIEMWGSTKGPTYGGDANSLWESNQRSIDGIPFKELMNEYCNVEILNEYEQSSQVLDVQITGPCYSLTKK
jgi:hypothetical protein